MVTTAASIPQEQPILITEQEAARLLGLSDRTVWQLRKDGKLRGIKIGTAVRYARSELDRFIEEQMNHVDANKTDNAPEV